MQHEECGQFIRSGSRVIWVASGQTGLSEGLTITPVDNSETLLTGPVVDQAALHGLLKKVRDGGMSLVSVMRVKSDSTKAKARQTGA